MNNNLLNLYKEKLISEEKSANTIKTYLNHIEEFLNHSNKELSEVKPIDIRMFLNSKDVSVSSKNLILSSINSFFSFLKDDMELLEKNPCEKIKSLKIKNKQEKIPLTQQQIHWLISSAKNQRDKTIIEMLANTGLRIHELINVTLEDYKYAKGNDGELAVIGKGDKLRHVYLNAKLMNDIDEYLKIRKESQFNNLFISNGGKKLDRSCVSRTLKTIARRSGRFSDEEINRLHNHLLRHSHFTNLSNNGVPIEVISELAGHSSINTSKIYVHISKNRAREAVQNFAI